MLPNQSQRLQRELAGRRINYLSTTLNQHMHLYGYKLIDLPIIDSADLFLVKAGDQIISSLFTFERQGKQFALRPEFTASAASYFASTEGDSIARWQFIGSVFEDNFQEPNAACEHLGIGAELIGLGQNLADAEIIAMSATGLEKVGIENYQITIGHIGLIRELLKSFNLDSRTEHFLLHQISALNDPNMGKQWVFDQFISQLAARGTQPVPTSENAFQFSKTNPNLLMPMGGRTQDDIVRRMRLKHQRLVDKDNVLAAIDYLYRWCQIDDSPKETFVQLSNLISGNNNAERLLQGWHDTILLLEAHEIPLTRITIKPSLARSWEYYTGIVFELHGNGKHLGGGGRYDELARLVGSQLDVPAVGFAYYGDRLLDILPSTKEDNESVIAIISNDSEVNTATKWANQIRNSGIAVQILPYAALDEVRSASLYLEGTAIRFRSSQYTFQQADLLINHLKQIQ